MGQDNFHHHSTGKKEDLLMNCYGHSYAEKQEITVEIQIFNANCFEIMKLLEVLFGFMSNHTKTYKSSF